MSGNNTPGHSDQAPTQPITGAETNESFSKALAHYQALLSEAIQYKNSLQEKQ